MSWDITDDKKKKQVPKDFKVDATTYIRIKSPKIYLYYKIAILTHNRFFELNYISF